MSVTVRLPGSLKTLADGRRSVEVPSDTVGEAIQDLCAQFPPIGERILDAAGRPRRFVNIYVNGDDVRLLAGDETPLNDGDEVIIVPAVAGG
jgi:MoaD family protein